MNGKVKQKETNKINEGEYPMHCGEHDEIVATAIVASSDHKSRTADGTSPWQG
jgi:hypothetical protein